MHHKNIQKLKLGDVDQQGAIAIKISKWWHHHHLAGPSHSQAQVLDGLLLVTPQLKLWLARKVVVLLNELVKGSLCFTFVQWRPINEVVTQVLLEDEGKGEWCESLLLSLPQAHLDPVPLEVKGVFTRRVLAGEKEDRLQEPRVHRVMWCAVTIFPLVLGCGPVPR